MPLSTSLQISTSNLPKYFEGNQKGLSDFANSLIEEDDLEFYKKLSINFSKQPEGKGTELFLTSCLLRHFLKAEKLDDLKLIEYSGSIPKMIIDINNQEQEGAKKNAMVSNLSSKIDGAYSLISQHIEEKPLIDIILSYQKEESPSQIFLKYLDNDAIFSEGRDFLQLPESYQEAIEDLSLEKLSLQQQGVTAELERYKITQKVNKNEESDNLNEARQVPKPDLLRQTSSDSDTPSPKVKSARVARLLPLQEAGLGTE